MKKPIDWRSVFIALIALFAGGFFVQVVVETSDDGKTKTIRAESGKRAAAPAGDLQASKPEPGDSEGANPSDLSLRDTTPEGVPKETLEDAELENHKLAEQATDPQPTGGSQNYSCTKDFRGHLWYDGAKVVSGKLHYTVSGNIKGPGDVRGVQTFFLNGRHASSTFIIDFEGNCVQMVPLDKCPWTQGAFNCSSWSVEIIATGKETRAQWLASDLFKKRILAELVRDTQRKLGLPLKFVDPVGCVDTLGYTDHDHLECGNDHTDVSPHFPFDVLAKQLVAEDEATQRLLKARRSHRIVHAKLGSKRCRGAKASSRGCKILRSQNRALHKKYGTSLS